MAEIELVQGDITTQNTDAIVNAANNELWMGSGVAGAIKHAGGIEIEEEAIGKGPIPIGEAVATGAGRLRCRYVIHAAAMGQDLVTDALRIADATTNSLRRADELGLESIAFPALGTGVGAFPPFEAAQAMISSVQAYEAEHPDTHIKRVVFCLFGRDIYAAFEEVLRGEEEG